jgi:hypothetical protein
MDLINQTNQTDEIDQMNQIDLSRLSAANGRLDRVETPAVSCPCPNVMG